MKEKENIWEQPQFDEKGFTQWYWRVLYPENFKFRKKVKIGSFTVIDAMKGVEIEDNVEIGFGCSILSYSSIDKKAGKVLLKRNCKIGSNTVIMPGVSVGENAIVGANSFVNRDIPSNEVWAGSPVRSLKKVENDDASE